MTAPGRSPEAGLTLVEVLVSLAIFAVIGAAGLTVLNTMARTSEASEGRLERLAEIDRALLVIRRDLLQLLPQPVTLTEDGLRHNRALGDSDAIGVAYRLEAGTLVRRVERATQDPVDQSLLEGVVSARWRLLDGARAWHGDWPPAGQEAGVPPFAAELALEVTQPRVADPQVLTRLVVLPAGSGR